MLDPQMFARSQRCILTFKGKKTTQAHALTRARRSQKSSWKKRAKARKKQIKKLNVDSRSVTPFNFVFKRKRGKDLLQRFTEKHLFEILILSCKKIFWDFSRFCKNRACCAKCLGDTTLYQTSYMPLSTRQSTWMNAFKMSSS